MNKSISESFNFLMKELNRLKFKEKNKTISKEEKETLQKLESFIGVSDD